MNIPVFAPGSPNPPSSPAGIDTDLASATSIFTNPSSPMDVSLQKEPPPSGKDIRNQLRRKIRRQSVCPYQRQPSVAYQRDENPNSCLPMFADLGVEEME